MNRNLRCDTARRHRGLPRLVAVGIVIGAVAMSAGGCASLGIQPHPQLERAVEDIVQALAIPLMIAAQFLAAFGGVGSHDSGFSF